jgi:hypothetical protein
MGLCRYRWISTEVYSGADAVDLPSRSCQFVRSLHLTYAAVAGAQNQDERYDALLWTRLAHSRLEGKGAAAEFSDTSAIDYGTAPWQVHSATEYLLGELLICL